MPYFKVRNENRLIVSNFKVMFSSLKQERSLKKIKRYEAFFYTKTSKPSLHMVVRNPYHRALSFYKDKFKSIPLNNRENPTFKWEKPQRVFFPLLGVTNNNTTQDIADLLTNVSFKTFVSMLTQIYAIDEHINPQCWILNHPNYKLLKTLVTPEEYLSIYKMENLTEMVDFRFLTGCSLNQKCNNTQSINIEEDIDHDSIANLNRIYQQDFKMFGYSMKSVV